MTQAIRFANGVLYQDGQPQFMLSADYPYYRDAVENWQPRLRQLKELGIPVVTFYVPWRHHEVDGQLDFDGRTRPNRNVVHFLELIRDEGLQAVVKPGPFIHAELDFGGLPDEVCAGEKYEPMLGWEGKWRHWHRYLPAPLGENFSRRVITWFAAAVNATVAPFLYPNGPVIATQVLNEGMYSSGQRALTFYDYSASSVAEYRRRFGAGAPVPHAFTPPTSVKDVLPYLWWGRWQGDFIGELYRRFGEPLNATGLPVLTNQNPAAEDPLGMDWWLTRINPERWPWVHYGFTNWIGVVSHNEHCFNRYLLLCKRQPGPNLEENWGFSELYDRRYRFTVIPFFQTVLAIAAGATGFNVYTGVGTAHWDDHIDTHMQRPYPDSAPIGAEGELNAKAETLRVFSEYLRRYGGEIVESRLEAPVAWALYPAYAAVASWSVDPADWAGIGVKPVRCGTGALDNFQRTMRLESRDYQLLNIEEAKAIDPQEYPALTLCGGFFMDAGTQRRLLDYVRSGGVLVICHDMPRYDDNMEPCTILADGLTADTGAGRFRFVPSNPFEAGPSGSFLRLLDDLGFPATVKTGARETQAWVKHGPGGADHWFILSTAAEPGEHRAGPVTVRLPGRSAAILRVQDGRLTAALIKGINDCDGTAAAPYAECGGVSVSAAAPCDLLWTAEGTRVETSHLN